MSYADLMTMVYGGDDLSEEFPGLFLLEYLPGVDVVVDLTAARVLHDDDDLLLVLKHCNEISGTH